MYFYNKKLYPCFCKVYVTHFSESSPKLLKCTEIVKTITEKDEKF